MAGARDKKVEPLVANSALASKVVEGTGISRSKKSNPPNLSSVSSAQASAPRPCASMEVTKALGSSESSLGSSNDQPSSQKTGAADAVKPVPAESTPFVTSAKRKQLEIEGEDIIITKTVKKSPKPPSPPTYEQLMQENNKLKKEIHELRLARDKLSSAEKVIASFVISASIMETAIDVREGEMRKGFNAVSEAMTKVEDHLAEMVKFSNVTTDVTGRIVQSANDDHQLQLTRAEEQGLQHLYENAKPGRDVAGAIHAKLSFTPKARGRPRASI